MTEHKTISEIARAFTSAYNSGNTISFNATGLPGGVRYKRVGRPRIRKDANAIWVCSDDEARGFGYSPAAAWTAWVRNHFIGSPRPPVG